MMSKRTEPYLHGTRPKEQRRLSKLNDLLNAACLRELALQGGERVLDVGSGLGQFSRAMARATGPRGRVMGVDRDERQVPAYVANMIGVVETARDMITGPLGMGVNDFDSRLRETRAWGRRPDASIWFGLCWAEGRRP